VQVTSWDFLLDEDVADLLLSPNYRGIESLTLRSPHRQGFPILESEYSEFPGILYECPNLLSLSIVQTHEFEDQIVEPVDEDVLSDFKSFLFLNSLRSLSLDLERFNGRTTVNELEFSTLFPSLEYLNITFRSSNLDEIDSKSFLLPKLTSLEVVNCPFLHLPILIHCLDLPSISSINLAQSGAQLYEPTLEEETVEIGRLVAELGAYSSTLQTFRFTLSGLSARAVEELRGLQDDVTIEVNSELVVFSSETADTSNRSQVQPSDTQDAGDPSLDDLIDSDMSDPAHRQKLTKELLTWAQERVNGCEDVDDAGVEEMMRVLVPVKELKEWLED